MRRACKHSRQTLSGRCVRIGEPMSPTVSFQCHSFATWAAVIAYVRRTGFAWYKAPLDARPVHVRCFVRGKHPRKIRVHPARWREADPFWADAGHLDRFFFHIRPECFFHGADVACSEGYES